MNVVKSFFMSEGHNPNPPMPALSEHSTSTPTPRFQSPVTLPCAPNDPTLEFISLHAAQNDEVDQDESDDSDYDDTAAGVETAPNEPSELMQLDLSEDIRLGSPDNDGSNYLESDFQLLAVENPSPNNAAAAACCSGGNSLKAIQVPSSDPLAAEEGSYYSQTVSTILEHQSTPWPSSNPSSAAATATSGAFSNWTPSLIQGGGGGGTSTAQSALKYILFTVPGLHAKPRDTKQDDFSASHVIAERRRREKLKERFIMLRSLVPFVTKMDKASILGDTIEYVKQLRKRIQELEKEKKVLSKWKKKKEKEKEIRVLEEGEAAAPETRGEMAAEGEVEVSIIEKDALVEIKCKYREGVLLEVMQLLRGMKVEVTTVQSSLANGVFVAELRAKLKENVRDRKASIRRVKRSINQVILCPFSGVG